MLRPEKFDIKGIELKVLLRKADNRWFEGDRPVFFGQTNFGTHGWTYTVTTLRRSQYVTASLGHSVKYMCNITRGKRILLLPQGVIELSVLDRVHEDLAQVVLDALLLRPSGTVFTQLTVLKPGEIDGFTFRTKTSYPNNFSDGCIEMLSGVHSRRIMRCNKGTYLVRTFRHSDHRIFAIEVFVEPEFSRKALELELRRLA